MSKADKVAATIAKSNRVGKWERFRKLAYAHDPHNRDFIYPLKEDHLLEIMRRRQKLAKNPRASYMYWFELTTHHAKKGAYSNEYHAHWDHIKAPGVDHKTCCPMGRLLNILLVKYGETCCIGQFDTTKEAGKWTKEDAEALKRKEKELYNRKQNHLGWKI